MKPPGGSNFVPKLEPNIEPLLYKFFDKHPKVTIAISLVTAGIFASITAAAMAGTTIAVGAFIAVPVLAVGSLALLALAISAVVLPFFIAKGAQASKENFSKEIMIGSPIIQQKKEPEKDLSIEDEDISIEEFEKQFDEKSKETIDEIDKAMADFEFLQLQKEFGPGDAPDSEGDIFFTTSSNLEDFDSSPIYTDFDEKFKAQNAEFEEADENEEKFFDIEDLQALPEVQPNVKEPENI